MHCVLAAWRTGGGRGTGVARYDCFTERRVAAALGQASCYPIAQSKIRWEAIKLAICRTMVKAAQETKRRERRERRLRMTGHGPARASINDSRLRDGTCCHAAWGTLRPRLLLVTFAAETTSRGC